VDLTVVVREEGDGYWSEVRQLPGCFASARTLDELREALGESIGLYLWDQPVELFGPDLYVGETEVEVTAPTSGK
jgi:predicted RNase H-like HicB family nuclease